MAGSVEAAHHGAGWDAERGRGLVVGEAIDVDELHDVAVPLGQASKYVREPSRRCACGGDVLGARCRRVASVGFAGEVGGVVEQPEFRSEPQ